MRTSVFFLARLYNRYGKRILSLGIEEAKKIGLREVLITCMEDNVGSKKIIESNGAVFFRDFVIPEQGKMLKYQIVLA